MMQTVKTPIRRRVLWHVICPFTVWQCPILKTLVIYGSIAYLARYVNDSNFCVLLRFANLLHVNEIQTFHVDDHRHVDLRDADSEFNSRFMQVCIFVEQNSHLIQIR